MKSSASAGRYGLITSKLETSRLSAAVQVEQPGRVNGRIERVVAQIWRGPIRPA